MVDDTSGIQVLYTYMCENLTASAYTANCIVEVGLK